MTHRFAPQTTIKAHLHVLVAVLTVLITTATTAAAESTPSLVDEYNRFKTQNDPKEPVDKLIRVGRFDRAISILKENPNLYHEQHLLILLLAANFNLQRFQDVITASKLWLNANQSAEQDSKGLIYELIGSAELSSQNYDKAIQAFKTSHELDPTDSSESGIQKAVAMKEGKSAPPGLNEGTRDEPFAFVFLQCSGLPAIETYGQMPPTESNLASSERSTNAANLISRARRLEDRGDFSMATGLYKEATRTASNDSALWSALGLCQMTDAVTNPNADKNAELKEAEESCLKSISLNKQDWRLSNNLAVVQYIRDVDRVKLVLDKLSHDKTVPAEQLYWVRNALFVVRARDMLKEHYQPKENSPPVILGK